MQERESGSAIRRIDDERQGRRTGSHGDKVDSKDQGNERRGRRGKEERIRMRDATFSGMSRGGKSAMESA